jgi:chromosome segregation ATPase
MMTSPNSANTNSSSIPCTSSSHLNRTFEHNELKEEYRKYKETAAAAAAKPGEESKALSEKLAAGEKLAADQTKLAADQTKLAAEQAKLAAELQQQVAAEKKTNAELEAKLEAAKAEVKAVQEMMQKQIANRQQELADITQQRDLAIAAAHEAEASSLVQLNLSLEAPPQKELEEKLAAMSRQLHESAKKTSEVSAKAKAKEKELADLAADVTQRLEETHARLQQTEKKAKESLKEKALEYETLLSKLKESKLDASKLKSTLDRKDMEINRLHAIIKQLETQKADTATAVLTFLHLPPLDTEDGRKPRAAKRRSKNHQNTIQGATKYGAQKRGSSISLSRIR